MPVIFMLIGTVGSWLAGVAKSINPISVAKTVARISIILVLITSFIGFYGFFFNTLVNILSLINTFSSDVANNLNGNGSSSSVFSCFKYLMTQLGIYTLINSFFFSLVGLFTLWFGFISATISIKATLALKKFLFKALE